MATEALEDLKKVVETKNIKDPKQIRNMALIAAQKKINSTPKQELISSSGILGDLFSNKLLLLFITLSIIIKLLLGFPISYWGVAAVSLILMTFAILDQLISLRKTIERSQTQKK